MCQKTCAEQASKAMFALKSSLVNYTNISTDILFKIIDSKIQPILTYAKYCLVPLKIYYSLLTVGTNLRPNVKQLGSR